MTELSEAPYGLVERFLAGASSAGLTAAHLSMLVGNPDLFKEWIASLPDPEPADAVTAPTTTIGAAARLTLEEAFSNGKVDERILAHLVDHMGLKCLDEVTQLCADELLQIRNFGPATLRRVEQVLAEYGLHLAVHGRNHSQHASFVLPYGGWGVLYASSDNVRLTSLVRVRITVGQQVPTVGEFRAMSAEDRLQLFDEWTVGAILAALDRLGL